MKEYEGGGVRQGKRKDCDSRRSLKREERESNPEERKNRKKA